MTRRAVLICPGRGTYNKAELGYLARHHANKSTLIAGFDAVRVAAGRTPVSALDTAESFSTPDYARGDVASALIYACAYADAQSLAADIEVVAVTGNSMGWYIALAVADALDAQAGFRLTDTMGALMHESLLGGQLVYPCWGEDWVPDPARKAKLLATLAEIGARDGLVLALSIDLGGMIVVAGDEVGLTAFAEAVPKVGPFPMRLPQHSGFHTALQAPVAERGRAALADLLPDQPAKPLIDGRGHVWWPGTFTAASLWEYTLGHQVTETYDFAAAIRSAAREFAPDLFIVTGPGTTLTGSVAQSLIACGWHGLDSRSRFDASEPVVIAMGDDRQRKLVT
jgi:acyl transferase domain-containing protein